MKDLMNVTSYCLQILKQEKYDVITELGSLKQEKNVNSSKNDKFTILSGGRLIYRKGFNLLLDAIEYIPSEYDFEVKLVGDGPQYRKLKKRVEKSNVLKNRIEMLGRVPHMKMESLYKMSNIFIMPSLRETTGSVIIEALENGIPVLAANMFGAKIILDDKCGLLYNIDEKEEVSERLANLIKKCIKNEIKVKNMTNDCLEKAKELSFENKIKKYEKIYSELCEKNSQNEE